MDAKKIEMVFLVSLFVLGIFNIYMASQTAFLGEDEAGYVELANSFTNLHFDATYSNGKHNVFPTFIPSLYSFFFMIFGSSLALAKMITAIFGLLTLFVVYLIGRKINVYVGMLSVASLLLMSFFSHMSLLAYVDVPTAFFSALFVYIFTAMKDSMKKSLVLGAILGISYFVKVSTFFIMIIFGLYVLYEFFTKRDKNQLKFGLLTILVAALIVSPYIIRNIALYNYPYFIVLDILFPSLHITGWVGPGTASSTPLLNLGLFISAFDWLPLLIGIFGIAFVFAEKNEVPKQVKFSTALFLSFIAIFVVLYIMGKIIAEPRYLMIVFPELAVISGFFLYKLSQKSKYLSVLIIIMIILGFYTSMTMSLATEQSQRYPTSYVQALQWIDKNTPKDSLVFTTFSGSVNIYAHRQDIWTEIVEFADIMTTDNATFIHDTLKRYNVSYVAIWSGVVAQTYFVPNANLAGVFSYQFVNTVLNSPENFNITYQNQENAVLKVV
jgi:4-amino-4-deoxy-L-arabinose transferase-like glycosyltransferase